MASLAEKRAVTMRNVHGDWAKFPRWYWCGATDTATAIGCNDIVDVADDVVGNGTKGHLHMQPEEIQRGTQTETLEETPGEK